MTPYSLIFGHQICEKKNGALFFSLDNDVSEVLVQDISNHPPKYTASYSTDRSSDIRSRDLVWR